ncbi:MAG: DUF1320 domain-containing protein [Alphaproteobacteria bacterium]|nr:DUF1320 domain-containing protein [Alphaproteobacteria bacterium]
MTAYATTADLQAAIGEPEMEKLTDGSFFTPLTPNFDRGADALLRASAEIDSYLSRQYPLPLAQVPPMLKVVCCDIAVYRLWQAPTEDVISRYDRAVKWLRDVADGKIGLGLQGDLKVPVEASRRLGSVGLAI